MNGKLHVRIGNLVDGYLYGGPYVKKPDWMLGVKMAVEIKKPCQVDIPTADFNVPDVAVFKKGLMETIMLLHQFPGKTLDGKSFAVYAGCWGGIGRTGLVMAGLAKVMSEYRKAMHRPTLDPVTYVRAQYIPHAVETPQQQQYIEDLDVSDIVEWCRTTQAVLAQMPKPVIDLTPLTEALQSVKDQFAEPTKIDFPLYDVTGEQNPEPEYVTHVEPAKPVPSVWDRWKFWVRK